MKDTGRSYQINVRVSRFERESLIRQAEEEGVSIAAVARRLMYQGKFGRLIAKFFPKKS